MQFKLNDIEFLNMYRLTKAAFWRIVKAIKTMRSLNLNVGHHNNQLLIN